MIAEILEILTRAGVIEPITLTIVFSTLIHGFFRFKSKKIELQRLKIELLKSQSEVEVKQRLENLEEIITHINQEIKSFDYKNDNATEIKNGQEIPSNILEE